MADTIHWLLLLSLLLLEPTGLIEKICNAHLASCKSHKEQFVLKEKSDRQAIQIRRNYRF